MVPEIYEWTNTYKVKNMLITILRSPPQDKVKSSRIQSHKSVNKATRDSNFIPGASASQILKSTKMCHEACSSQLCDWHTSLGCHSHTHTPPSLPAMVTLSSGHSSVHNFIHNSRNKRKIASDEATDNKYTKSHGNWTRDMRVDRQTEIHTDGIIQHHFRDQSKSTPNSIS